MRFSLIVLFVLLTATIAAGQANPVDTGPIRSSPAYSEVLLKRTELLAELDALSADYTEANPKMLDLRAELASIDKSIERLFAVRPSESEKLTLALGKLIVKKAELETELGRLSRSFAKEHPDVKRAKRRVEIFENAIKEILK